jgi:hypothetical protein
MRSWLLACLSFAVIMPSPTCGRGQVANPKADSIVLERTLCYGTCPAYRLSLTRAGLVRFESRNPTDSGRTASDTVGQAVVLALEGRAATIGFFELPEVIAGDKRLCPDSATDHPTATLTMFLPGRTARVVDYHGCFQAVDHSVVDAVQRLRAFEAAVDSAARSERWVRPARRR